MADDTFNTTTNRSDFAWPFLAERQRIFDWDRYEYKRCDPDVPPPQQPLQRSFQNAETLKTIPDSQKLSFDFDFRPKPILGRPRQSADRLRFIEVRRHYVCFWDFNFTQWPFRIFITRLCL